MRITGGTPVAFVLAEYGPGNWNDSEPANPPYDCRTLMKDLHEYLPKTCAFMFWGDNFLPSRQGYAREMMEDPSVLCRVDLCLLKK